MLVPVLCTTLSADPVLLEKSSSGLNTPTGADVATEKGIEQIAFQWWLINGGLSADESLVIAGNFSASRPIKGFAEVGDVIWEVRAIRSFKGLTGVLWINEKTGKVEALGRDQK
jgi:hypothetical protein